MKKIKPYFLFIISIIFVTFVWDKISIPFDIESAHVGDSYLDKLHHPQNDTLRFITYLSIPFLVLIFYYQMYEKIFFKNLKSVIFEYDNLVSENPYKLKVFLWITISLIILEFFFIDFENLDHQIDIFHEGLWLTPSTNIKIKNEFWQSSYILRGFFGNFYPYFLWKFFNVETIGIVRFFGLFVVLLNKILLLLIAYRISISVSFNNNAKVIFYLLMSLTFLIFTSYMSPIFLLRSFLLLIFMILLLNFIILKNKKIINLFLIGLLSSLGMFWYIDIGIYINAILFLFLIFLIFKRQINFFLVLLFSVITGWLALYFYIPDNEFNQFLINLKLAIYSIEYIQGLIFPTPFLSQDARATKTLLLFLITGFFIIQEINNGKKTDLKFLLIISVFFIVSIFFFKYGLSRSDSAHIREASSFLYIPLISIFYYKIIEFIFNKKIIFLINLKTISHLLLIIFLSSIFLNKKYENKSYSNFISSNTSIKKLINFPDERFLSNDYNNFVLYYKNLSLKDECSMIFTNEVAIPYFLKKPTCSKYFLMYSATPNYIQKSIIEDLENKSPSYIVYKSDIDLYGHAGSRLNLLDDYIRNEYSFFKKIKYWEIYKKN